MSMNGVTDDEEHFIRAKGNAYNFSFCGGDIV